MDYDCTRTPTTIDIMCLLPNNHCFTEDFTLQNQVKPLFKIVVAGRRLGLCMMTGDHRFRNSVCCRTCSTRPVWDWHVGLVWRLKVKSKSCSIHGVCGIGSEFYRSRLDLASGSRDWPRHIRRWTRGEFRRCHRSLRATVATGDPLGLRAGPGGLEASHGGLEDLKTKVAKGNKMLLVTSY